MSEEEAIKILLRSHVRQSYDDPPLPNVQIPTGIDIPYYDHRLYVDAWVTLWEKYGDKPNGLQPQQTKKAAPQE